MKKQYFISTSFFAVMTTSLLSLSSATFAKEQHTNTHHEHDKHDIEMGVSVGYAYLEEENEGGTNLHLHIMKKLSGEGIQKYLSVGIGFETIFAHEQHNAAMLALGIHPWNNVVFTVSAGTEWAKHNGVTESGSVMHLEATYLFEAEGYHYGPVVGYAKTHEDQHYTVGMHFGFPL